MEQDREKSIREDGQFQGMVIATLKAIQKEQVDVAVALIKHLEEEMIELKEFNVRLQKLENWKIKVATVSGVAGSVATFIISFVLNKI